MHRPLPVAREENDRQQIQETLGQTRPAVFGRAPRPGMMLDRQFADPESLGAGQDRCEAVQFAVETDRRCDLAAVGLEATIEVVQWHAGGHTNGPVEDLARCCFTEWILATLLPAGNEI